MPEVAAPVGDARGAVVDPAGERRSGPAARVEAEGRHRSHRWHRWPDVALLVAVVILAAVGGLRWLDSTAYVVVVLQTAGPFVVIGLAVVTVTALLLRRWIALVPAVAALTVGAVVAAPSFASVATPDADRDLTVMSSNLMFGRANPRQLMDAVRYHAVDVLVLTEATPDAVARIDDAGARTYFTVREGQARENTYTGTVVLSRYPLSVVDAGDDPDVEATESLQPELDVTLPNGLVRLKVAHPTAPLRGDTVEWRAGLRQLAEWKREQPGRRPLLLAGDFNAAFGHPGFRDVASGLVDAQRAVGSGWVRTWPFSGRTFPAYVQIDHLLSSGLDVVAAGQVGLNGADHAAVWASYAWVGR